MSVRNALVSVAPIAVIGLVSLACASGSRELSHDYASATRGPVVTVGPEAVPGTQTQRMADLITRADIVGDPVIAAGSAYDAVLRLRPTFLRSREIGVAGAARGGQPAIFFNDLFAGEVDVLRSIPATAVTDIRHIRAVEAMNRYGPNYTAGIIVVRMVK